MAMAMAMAVVMAQAMALVLAKAKRCHTRAHKQMTLSLSLKARAQQEYSGVRQNRFLCCTALHTSDLSVPEHTLTHCIACAVARNWKSQCDLCQWLRENHSFDTIIGCTALSFTLFIAIDCTGILWYIAAHFGCDPTTHTMKKWKIFGKHFILICSAVETENIGLTKGISTSLLWKVTQKVTFRLHTMFLFDSNFT